jgi:hypothetical protein
MHKRSMVCKQIEAEKKVSADTNDAKMTCQLKHEIDVTKSSNTIRKFF